MNHEIINESVTKFDEQILWSAHSFTEKLVIQDALSYELQVGTTNKYQTVIVVSLHL